VRAHLQRSPQRPHRTSPALQPSTLIPRPSTLPPSPTPTPKPYIQHREHRTPTQQGSTCFFFHLSFFAPAVHPLCVALCMLDPSAVRKKVKLKLEASENPPGRDLQVYTFKACRLPSPLPVPCRSTSSGAPARPAAPTGRSAAATATSKCSTCVALNPETRNPKPEPVAWGATGSIRSRSVTDGKVFFFYASTFCRRASAMPCKATRK
jgi:hypothetical protein